MNLFIRAVAIFFALAFSYLSLSFSVGVGENVNVAYLIVFLLLGVLSQSGLFLSTFIVNSLTLRFLIGVIMLPFFVLLLKSTFFDANFLSRLTGAGVQIASSVAYVVGLIAYMLGYYKLVVLQYNKRINEMDA
ncbi:hypothetical protein tinsulaeT_00490 [Thalassotalea insulae]|uniref:Integral membrane protein n=1 Tax=Thalassotalea insulae TaxID=2056778 RepID=A0ABQ6GM71_9GAMM|nr:hypothetical protein [Thalassotalea insulae]GLX76709.1 hypothetical protein tinsulaeT_00490 [Thalassotalea insulae]